MSEHAESEGARWRRYDREIRRVLTCSGTNCTTEDHIRALRFWMLTAYDDGVIDGRRSAAEPATRPDGR